MLCSLQLGSPIKKPASVKTPTGREGHLVGGADCSQLLLGVADEEYTVIDCESSVTALDMVQLSLDKQGDSTPTGVYCETVYDSVLL